MVATTVHPLQVLEEALPETDHDFRLDLIVASEEVIGCRRTRRPQGAIWEHLDPAKIAPAKIAAIPALAAQATRSRNQHALMERPAMSSPRVDERWPGPCE